MNEDKLENLIGRFEKSVNMLERLLVPISETVVTSTRTDAETALMGLGFKKSEVNEVLNTLTKHQNFESLESLIRESLKQLRK